MYLNEQGYLKLAKKVIDEGAQRGDRTGTGTVSLFGEQMRFDLTDGKLPLLTTKKVFFRGVLEELLWFVRGSTNANELAARGVTIWNEHGSREFLNSQGLNHREVGDLGPVYGFQWRHAGAEYRGMREDYAGEGVDQLAALIDAIKHSPESRRLVMSSWSPIDLPDMALPPCHVSCQFYVSNGQLSCHMYQRSCDMGLGVPFNVASYGLLTHMVAYICDLTAKELIVSMGDVHVYLDHIPSMQEQLMREPTASPKIRIRRRQDLQSIDDFRVSDFEVEGYNPAPAIKMKMAV